MIEVRIDIDWMQTQQQNIMHSITMMQMLREAGMPVIGKIIFNGPERGKLISWRVNDLDGDEWVVRWYDDGEPDGDPNTNWTFVDAGHGKGFMWRKFAVQDGEDW